MEEIGGVELNNIARCEPVPFGRLDGYAPLLEHGSSRNGLLKSKLVALKLYDFIDGSGRPKFRDKQDALNHFRLRPDSKLVLTGVHHEGALEKLWRSEFRPEIVENLKNLDIALVTSPNFSIVLDHPWTEHSYNIKRICLIASEFLSAGIPTALHVNACTDRAYERIVEFLSHRPEFEAISFDFITGANSTTRMEWHAAKLLELSSQVGRPIQLVTRGGLNVLHRLTKGFAHILAIDAEPFMKAVYRQRLIIGNDGRTVQKSSPLARGHPIDDLLDANIRSHVHMVNLARSGDLPPLEKKPPLAPSRRTRDRDHDARQMSLLLDFNRGSRGAGTSDNKRVVSAPNSKKAG